MISSITCSFCSNCREQPVGICWKKKSAKCLREDENAQRPCCPLWTTVTCLGTSSFSPSKIPQHKRVIPYKAETTSFFFLWRYLCILEVLLFFPKDFRARSLVEVSKVTSDMWWKRHNCFFACLACRRFEDDICLCSGSYISRRSKQTHFIQWVVGGWILY